MLEVLAFEKQPTPCEFQRLETERLSGVNAARCCKLSGMMKIEAEFLFVAKKVHARANNAPRSCQ